MNTQMSKLLNFSQECSFILPTEIVHKILIKHNGLIHPTALLIKNKMKEQYLIEYTQLDYFIKYENISADEMGESVLDHDFIHFTLEGDEDESKYINLWFDEFNEINRIA